MSKGYLITVEGPDGSGKSTIIKVIAEYLKNNNKQFLITKEPGSPHDKFCLKMRELMLDPENDVDGRAEIFGMMTDRCQHVYKVIRPALKEGKIVISDRYIDSTYAYQGWGRRGGKKEELEYINFLNEKTTGNLIPDLTILVMVKPEVGLKRISTKEFGEPDRFEKEKIDFHKKIYKGFLDLYEKYKDKRNFFLIDTTNTDEEKTKEYVLECLSEFFGK